MGAFGHGDLDKQMLNINMLNFTAGQGRRIIIVLFGIAQKVHFQALLLKVYLLFTFLPVEIIRLSLLVISVFMNTICLQACNHHFNGLQEPSRVIIHHLPAEGQEIGRITILPFTKHLTERNIQSKSGRISLKNLLVKVWPSWHLLQNSLIGSSKMPIGYNFARIIAQMKQ